MNGSLNGIDVFVTVVETGSFASAAEHLHLTRSAVTKTIARMETRLKVRLLHRTTRRQSLTEDGQVYYKHCERALQEIRAAEAVLDSGRHEASGRLRVSVPLLFGRRCVAPVLTQLVADHPKIELDLSFSDRPIDLIEDGFDLAIRNGEVDEGLGLMTRTMSLQRMTVCAAPAYLGAHGRPERLDDLEAHRGIVYGRAGRIHHWEFPISDKQIRKVTPPSRLRFDDLEAIADATEAGHGLAWLPCWLIRERVGAGQLVPLLDNVPRLVIRTHALWPATPHLPWRVRLAINALAATLPGRAEL